MATVVIDPGHGGSTSVGGSSWNNAVGPNGTLEKTLTLDVGLRAHAALAARGHNARLTRSTDVNLGLAARAKVSKNNGAAAFVSIHFNGSNAHNAQGTETLVHSNHSNLSARLSLAVQDAMLAVTGLRDRNLSFDPSRIKPQALGVLRPTRHLADTAACLVEVSFLDRADEEERLRDEAYRQAIGVAIADGVEAYLGLPVSGGVSADAEVEDAIEVSATGFGASIISFLGLDNSSAATGGAEEKGEGESSGRHPFTADFIGGAGSDALFVAQPDDTGNLLEDFKAFIAPLNLRFFSADEVLFLGNSHHGSGSCGGKNAHPPRELWENIVPTIQMLDEIRARLGSPIRIMSCYRNDAYNECVGGVENSLHKRFIAVDFTAQAGTPEIWRRIAEEVRATDLRFNGGIGTYLSRNFVHVDTRGEEANWVEE